MCQNHQEKTLKTKTIWFLKKIVKQAISKNSEFTFYVLLFFNFKFVAGHLVFRVSI